MLDIIKVTHFVIINQINGWNFLDFFLKKY